MNRLTTQICRGVFQNLIKTVGSSQPGQVWEAMVCEPEMCRGCSLLAITVAAGGQGLCWWYAKVWRRGCLCIQYWWLKSIEVLMTGRACVYVKGALYSEGDWSSQCVCVKIVSACERICGYERMLMWVWERDRQKVSLYYLNTGQNRDGSAIKYTNKFGLWWLTRVPSYMYCSLQYIVIRCVDDCWILESL